jgi:hypothetical protein
MHWYALNLRQLAEKIGREAEYDGFYASFSGAVHSSAKAVHGQLPISMEFVSIEAAHYCVKTMLAALDWCQMKLGDVDMKLLRDLAHDRLFEPAQPTPGGPSSAPPIAP